MSNEMLQTLRAVPSNGEYSYEAGFAGGTIRKAGCDLDRAIKFTILQSPHCK
jgi:hypothetical protein